MQHSTAALDAACQTALPKTDSDSPNPEEEK